MTSELHIIAKPHPYLLCPLKNNFQNLAFHFLFSFALQFCFTKETYLRPINLENFFCFTERPVLPQTPNFPAENPHCCRRGWQSASAVKISKFSTAFSMSHLSSPSSISKLGICFAFGDVNGGVIIGPPIFFLFVSRLCQLDSLACLVFAVFLYLIALPFSPTLA